MLRSFTAKQFMGWEHFIQLEGTIADVRQDYLTASILQMLANINRDSKRRPSPYTLQDFLLRFGELEEVAPQRQTWQEQKLALEMAALAYSVAGEDL